MAYQDVDTPPAAGRRRPNGMKKSPFNNKEKILYDTATSFAYQNLFPLTPGHDLVIPKRRIAMAHRLDDEEIHDHMILASKLVAGLGTDPVGFTLGWNIGVAAGQTVAHSHMHVMPHYAWNMQRGGILRMEHIGVLAPPYEEARGSWPFPYQKVFCREGGAFAAYPEQEAKSGLVHVLIGHESLESSGPHENPGAAVDVFRLFRRIKQDILDKAACPPSGYNIAWTVGAPALYGGGVLDVIGRFPGEKSQKGIGSIFRHWPLS